MKKFVKTFTKTILAAGMMAMAVSAYAQTSANPPPPAANVSPAERAKIEQVVREYLLRKPEVLIEAMQVLQQRQFTQQKQVLKDTQKMAGKYISSLFHDANDPVAGNPNGKITVTEFFDYQCPHCVDMAPVMGAIIKSNPNVRIVFKDFPIRGPMSDLAARAAIAANKQGKYYELSHALLTSNKPLSPDVIYQLAKDNGLDVDKLKKDMNDNSVNIQIKNNMKLAQDLKLLGTPAFFIGKTDATASDNINYVPGQMNQQQLQDAINQAGK
jgi:protein-disulfide isomerase